MTQQQTTQPQVGAEVLNTKIGEPLTIAKRIGRGRLGVVYAGVHPVLARRFAIKVLRPGLTRDENIQRRLRRMIREASTVEHPNVVSLVDFGQLPDGSTFVVMDFVRGLQLTKALTQEGRFGLGRAVPILIQLADALEAAHKLRVVHGDVKPNNILLVEQANGTEQLRLHDFAITMALAGKPTDDDPIGHLRIYASVEYLSPEQINNARVDGRADIYAYGSVAYRILTGEPPFVGDTEEMIAGHKLRDPVPPSRRIGAHEVPPELDAIVLRCLEKNPADRFKTMEEVSRELKNLLPKPAAVAEEAEEITGRWKLPPELEEVEEPLPESPARQRQLFYDTMLDLAEIALKLNVASEEMQLDLKALRDDRGEAGAAAAQAQATENRFEDIRRELRERESTLRYAIIDLNLAKSDARERKLEDVQVRQIEKQIGELEQELAELERQRAERFAGLNVELQKSRDVIKSMEQKMAVHYRRLYAHLDDVRVDLGSDEARKLYRLLERCRAALARATTSREVTPIK